MNTIFSINRILLLIKIHLDDRWKLYLASYGIMVLLMFFPILMNESNKQFYPFAGMYVILIAGLVQAASVYGSWSNKVWASHYFMIPATITEKFTVAMLFSNVIFFPLLIVTYISTSFLIVGLFSPDFTLKELGNEYIEFMGNRYFRLLLGVIILIQSLFAFGAVYFSKRQFVMSSVVLTILFLLIIILPVSALQGVTGYIIASESGFLLDSQAVFRNAGETNISPRAIELSGIYGFINQLIWILVGIGLYAAAFFKLKEKEI